MTTYAYLEQALNADGVEAIQETNQELLDKATQLIDELVKGEHEFSSTHLGQHIVEGALDETYENVQEPTSDVVIEAVSTFADIISSTEYDNEEKIGLMQCASALIEAEEDPMQVVNEDAAAVFFTVGATITNTFKDLVNKGANLVGADAPFAPAFLRDMQQKMSELGYDASDKFSDVISAIKSGVGLDKSTLQKVLEWLANFSKESGITDSPIGSGFNSLVATIKENSSLGSEGAPVAAGALVGLVFVIAIFIAVKLWKSGGKKAALKLFGSIKKIFTKTKAKAKKK